MKKLQYYGPNRYRWKNELGAYRYFTIRTCRCGMRFLTDWYGKVRDCSSKCAGKVCGRPIGTKLSLGTKRRIGMGRTGKKHDPDTRKRFQSPDSYQLVVSPLRV